MSEPVLRFTQIHLENWKNFRAATVELPRRVFLVGPNASGKSNFLDAFRFLRDLVSVGGGLQSAIRQRGGVSAVRCLAARQRSDVVIKVSLGRGPAAQTWTYELSISYEDKQAVVRKERVTREGVAILERPLQEDVEDPQRLTQTFLEQVSANKEFREIAEFFGSLRYLHIVPQLVREPDRSVGRKNDPYGGDFLEQIASTPNKTRKSRLKRIREALQVAVPQLEELEIERNDRGTPHLRGKYEHWRLRGAWQTEEQFSDGTLRLMGLLWATLVGSGPLLLEEPELSLNAGVVRYIPQMFARLQSRAGRQILVSTHSMDLLNDTGVGLDEVMILEPTREGTSIRPATNIAQIRDLVSGGLSLGEAVLPHTQPARPEQLVLFGE